MDNLDKYLWRSVRDRFDPVDNLSPHPIPNPNIIVAMYDPFNAVKLSKQTIVALQKNGWFEDKQYEIREYDLFEDSWLATKTLRWIFSNNVYVFTKKGMLTNAIAVLSDDDGQINKWLRICEDIGLCCCMYSPYPKTGFELVQMNYEEDVWKSGYEHPNHLMVINCYQEANYTAIKPFQRWYVKIYKYNYKSYELQDTIDFLKRFLQWSWMKFLLPLACNENTVNCVELLKRTIQLIEKKTLVKCGPKFILNGAKIHPLQLCGVTNLLTFNHKLNGAEIPFRNFYYCYDSSAYQWIHAQGNWKIELMNQIAYQNDWISPNEEQVNLLQTFVYANYEELRKNSFPRNVTTIWIKSKRKIQERIADLDTRKIEFVDDMLQILYEIT